MYRSPNKVKGIKCRRLIWETDVARMVEERNDFKILTDKPTRKRTPGRHKRRCENNGC